MTKQERDKLRALALAATPGEWGLVKGSFLYQTDIKAGADTLLTVYGENGENAANAAYIAAANPATLLALLDRVDELEGELAASKVDAERYKRELQQKELVHVGYTNPYQIKYAKYEEGSFYPDTDNECYIPLYMLKKHKHRLGPDAAIDKARGQE